MNCSQVMRPYSKHDELTMVNFQLERTLNYNRRSEVMNAKNGTMVVYAEMLRRPGNRLEGMDHADVGESFPGKDDGIETGSDHAPQTRWDHHDHVPNPGHVSQERFDTGNQSNCKTDRVMPKPKTVYQSIQIDFDVHQLIQIERSNFDETPNDVLRRLLGLDMDHSDSGRGGDISRA